MLILSDTASTYGSLTTVNAGQLLTARSELLPDTIDLFINGGSYSMPSVTETIDALHGVGQVTFESGPGNHLIIGADNGSALFEGDVVPVGNGAGKLTKIGTGTQLFSGSVNVTEMTVDGGRVFVIGGQLTSTGLLNVAPSMAAQMTVHDGANIAAFAVDIGGGGLGDLVLKTGDVASAMDTVHIFANGRLAGDGQVNVDLVRNSGSGASRGIERGDAGDSAQLSLNGRYLQEPGGVLRIDIVGTGGAGAFDGNDVLVVSDNAELNGRLDLELINSFIPDHGDAFTILTYGSRNGTFDQVTLNGSILALPPDLALAPIYDFPGAADPRFAATPFAPAPDSLTLFTTLPGDLNLDLTVGDDDLNTLLSSFGGLGTTWTSGDVTGDGETGDADLNLLLSNFGTSVVLSGNASAFVSNTTVPEPGTLVVLWLGCLLIAQRRAP